LGIYHGELGKAVVRIKHSSSESLAGALARFLVDRRGYDLKSFHSEVVVPVPMHWLRRWRRGTNAPDVIGQAIAAQLDIAYGGGVLVRRRLTPLQVDSTLEQRRTNQRGSFRVASGYNLQGRRVLLVDDVLTSGATTDAAAKVLISAGAAEVNVAVLARAGIGKM
jgi:ComF family protein